jgi:hypothetical protein
MPARPEKLSMKLDGPLASRDAIAPRLIEADPAAIVQKAEALSPQYRTALPGPRAFVRRRRAVPTAAARPRRFVAVTPARNRDVMLPDYAPAAAARRALRR